MLFVPQTFIIIVLGKHVIFAISGQHSCEGIHDCHLGSTILSSQVGLTNVDSQTLLDEPVEITFPINVSAIFELFPEKIFVFLVHSL